MKGQTVGPFDNISKRIKAAINRRANQISNQMIVSHIRPALTQRLLDEGIVLCESRAEWEADRFLAEIQAQDLFGAPVASEGMPCEAAPMSEHEIRVKVAAFERFLQSRGGRVPPAAGDH